MDVMVWLRGLGLGKYEAAFRENDIDETVLPSLTHETLKDLGVTSVGHRLKLLDAIAALRTDAGAKAPAADAATPSTAPSAPPEDRAERRQVTVLFSDLVGSTALSARMDPEDLREVISAYQKCVAETVQRFGGFVAKYMGDGVLIYFGYPQAHEDDAERAVRTGVELVAAVSNLKTHAPLQTRVGIATGVVVVGDLIGSGASQEQAIVGETPNLAARLQGIAEPNEVVISEDTRKLVGQLFELEDLGATDLKGIAGSVRCWLVLRPASVESRFDALHATGLTELVGREEELELLLRRWSRARAGEGQVVLLSGEPGIGKSRLTAALMERLANEPHTRLRYFCSPQHTDSALYPIISQMERAAGFGHEDTPTAKLDKLSSLLAQSFTAVQDAVLLAEMLSLTNDGRYPTLELVPQQRRQRTFEALAAQLEALSRSNPILMIFEDVHWIDPTSLEALGRTVDRLRTLGILLILTYRPEFEPPWSGRPYVTVVSLNRLGQREIAALIDGVTGNKSLPDSIRQDIIERTDGIPLFVEEMTRAVLEAENEGEARRTAAAVPSTSLAVPPSLHASLMARLDRLGSAKEVAQVGAAIGREFSHALLAAVALKNEKELQSAIDALATAGLLFRQGTPPHATYLFKHALIRDAAYSTLLRAKRQELHALIARTFENHFAGLAEANPDQVARHFSDAGLEEKAVPYWSKAADRFARGYAVTEAIAMLNSGIKDIERLPQGLAQDRVHVDFALRLAQMIYLEGRFQESVQLLVDEEQRLGRAADPALTGPHHFWLAHMHSRLGNIVEAGRHARESVQAASAVGDDITLGKALSVMALNSYWAGQTTESSDFSRRAVEVLKRTQDRYWLGMAYCYWAMNQIQAGDTQGALDAGETMVRVGESIPDPRIVAYGKFFKGWAYAAADHHDAALRQCNQSLQCAPDAASRAYASAFIGYSCLAKREAAKAVDLLEKAVSDFSAFHFFPWEGLFSAKLAEARLLLGDLEGAHQAAEHGRDLTNKCGYRYGIGWACRALGHVAYAQGRVAEGDDLLNQALTIFVEIGATIELKRTLQRSPN
jgi:class 3 adenylate cyclase/tetratricopeptide (TPR) repeat protein